MIDFLRRKDVGARVVKATLLVAVLPLVFDFNITSSTTTNGEVTNYGYLGFTALIGGLAGLGTALKMFLDARYDGELTRAALVGLMVLVVVSATQVVRGTGLVPASVDCVAEYSADFCRPPAK